MSTAGPTIAGTGADGGGAVPWTSPGSITANDSVFATCPISGFGIVTNEILATNFGFSIPADATVNSVQVDIFRKKI